MKKIAKLLLLSTITFSTFSCNKKKEDPTIQLLKNKETILKSLNNLKNGNFTLSYEINSIKYEDIVTKDYYYISYLNLGAILLNTYGETPFSYDFEIANSKVNIKGQSFNEENTSQNVTNLGKGNALKNLPELSNDNLLSLEGTNDNKLIISDANIINVFSAQLDFYGISRILVSLDNDKNTVLEFQYIDNTTKEYVTLLEGGKVTIKNIGTSKIDIVESYLSSFTKPTENLVDKATNIFGNVSYVSAIYDVTLEKGGVQKALKIKETSLDIYNDYVSIDDYQDDVKISSLTYKKADEEGNLIKIGVNGRNEVISQPTTPKYSDFGFISKDNFELNKFVKLDKNDATYTYVGDKASNLAFSITQDSKIYSWKCQEIKVTLGENNNVEEFNFFTGLLLDKDTGKYFYRWINTRVLKEVNRVEEKENKKTPSKDDAAIKDVLNLINNEDAQYTVKTIDQAWEGTRETYFIKGSNFILKPTYIVTGETKKFEKESYEGYYKTNDGIYRFSYKEDNTITLLGEPYKDKTLKDFINFDLSSEILYKKDENTIITYSDIINIGDFIGFSLNPLTIDPSTLEIKLDYNKISTISYSYGYSKENISFNYESTSLNETIKTNLDEAIKATSSTVEFKNWNSIVDNFSGNAYSNLVSQYGEEFANKIPCYYVSSLETAGNDFDGYYDDYSDEKNQFYKLTFTSVYEQNYVNSYVQYLKDLGLITTDSKTFLSKDGSFKLVITAENEDTDCTIAFAHIYKLK